MKTPKFVLNALNHSITYAGITKIISDNYWNEEIIPILYPLWETEKNKIETYVRYDDDSSYMNKTKYVKNFQTNKNEWKSYVADIEAFSTQELNHLYEKLLEKYLDFKEIEHKDIESLLASKYAKKQEITWNKLILIRNFLLTDSDWSQMIDNKMNLEDKNMWKKYRQKLRDLTKTYKNMPPTEVNFPITPDKYKTLDDDSEYLSDTYGHFYKIDYKNISKLTQRIIHYLTLQVEIGKLDESEIQHKKRPSMRIDLIIENSVKLDDYIDYVLSDGRSLDAIINIALAEE